MKALVEPHRLFALASSAISVDSVVAWLQQQSPGTTALALLNFAATFWSWYLLRRRERLEESLKEVDLRLDNKIAGEERLAASRRRQRRLDARQALQLERWRRDANPHREDHGERVDRDEPEPTRDV